MRKSLTVQCEGNWRYMLYPCRDVVLGVMG